MTLEQEFHRQWASICNCIKAEILKRNSASIDADRLSAILENEKKKWFLPGQYNNAWFRKLQNTSPDVAERFENAIRETKIQPIEVKKSGGGVAVGLSSVLGAAAGFGVSRLFTFSVLTSAIVTVGGLAVGMMAAAGAVTNKQNNTLNELCTAYMEQLKSAGEILAQIVSEAK